METASLENSFLEFAVKFTRLLEVLLARFKSELMHKMFLGFGFAEAVRCC